MPECWPLILSNINCIHYASRLLLKKTTASSPSGDVEFQPCNLDAPDDEETIAAADAEASDLENELADLNAQNEMDITEIIDSLPPGKWSMRVTNRILRR